MSGTRKQRPIRKLLWKNTSKRRDRKCHIKEVKKNNVTEEKRKKQLNIGKKIKKTPQ